MFLISLIILSTCPKVEMINKSNEKWTKHDFKTLERAKQVCKTDERYKDTPCLKKFIKKEPRNFYAICGGYKK